MNIPSSKAEMIFKLHNIEQKSIQCKELTRDELFLILAKRLESSVTYEEQGYGQQ